MSRKSAHKCQLADKRETNQPREQRKDTTNWFCVIKHNARLRGWQRITQNSNTTTITTAAHWDWKRHALTVPLEAFVSFAAYCFPITFKHLCLKAILRKCIEQTHIQHQKLWSWLPKLKTLKAKLATVKSPRQRKHTFSDDAAFVKPNFPGGTSNNIEASKLDGFQRLWNCWTFNTFYQISIRKTRKPICEIWTLKADFWERLSLDFYDSSL